MPDKAYTAMDTHEKSYNFNCPRRKFLFGTIGWLRKKVYSGLIRLVPMLLRFEKRDSLGRLGALCHAKLSVSVLSLE